MEAWIVFVFVALTELKLISCVSTPIETDVIKKDVTFIHKTFTAPPSLKAIIEANVYVPKKLWRRYPMLGIYTTQDHINIEKQCTDTTYHQLGNNYLIPKSLIRCIK